MADGTIGVGLMIVPDALADWLVRGFHKSSLNKGIRKSFASAITSSCSSVNTKVKGKPREPMGGIAPTESTGIPVEAVIAGADTSIGHTTPFKWLLMILA